jgi:replication-associated recombination protein RarA
MRKLATARGRNSKPSYYHAVFIGNPGCAKTTCARLYAKVLASEGITKSDRFAELSRSTIVDKYVGSTAQNVRKLFEKNAGGVIFIDEAYTLCDSDPGSKNNFGIEAINELIVCLENHPETVVIFAGYPDKMEEFLSSNPGLRSRIPYNVAFSDYTTEELMAISKIIAGEQGYEITEPAMDKLSAIYDYARMQRNFGNGRYARNIVEMAVRTKGLRLGVMEKQLDDLMDHTRYTDSMLFSLDETCFEGILETPEKKRRRIGFYT